MLLDTLSHDVPAVADEPVEQLHVRAQSPHLLDDDDGSVRGNHDVNG